MNTVDLTGQHVVIVGGGSGMGKATAHRVAGAGARVTLSSRNLAKLQKAAADIGPDVHASVVDMTDLASVRHWAKDLGPVDHLVISASSAAHGRFSELPLTDVKGMFEAKFFGPYSVAKEVLPNLTKDSSITLFSGVLSRRPGVGTSGLAAVNAAVEGLVRALALELGPTIRVNGVSPGMAQTEAYAHMDPAQRDSMFADTGASLPVGRVGKPEEIAQVVMMLLANGFITGTILDVDGGHMVR